MKFRLFLFVTLIGSLSFGLQSHPPSGEEHSKTISETEAKAMIQDKAHQILLAIKNQDFPKLGSYIHPRKGVLFSPYGFIGESPYLVFHKTYLSLIPPAPTSPQKFVWGTYDGDDNDIYLTVKDYFKQHIFSHDFTSIHPTFTQAKPLKNSNNNIFEIFPDSIVVEYFYPGSHQEEEMDSRTLRLVFEQENGVWFLVAIINDAPGCC